MVRRPRASLEGTYRAAATPPWPLSLHFVSRASVPTQGTGRDQALCPHARPQHRGLQGAECSLEGAVSAVFLGLAKCCVKVKGRQGG